MKNERAYRTLDAVPPLTTAQRGNLERLARLPDSGIDTSDAPERSDRQWATAVRGRFFRPGNGETTA